MFSSLQVDTNKNSFSSLVCNTLNNEFFAQRTLISIKNLKFSSKKYDLIIGIAQILELKLLKVYAKRFTQENLLRGVELDGRDKNPLTPAGTKLRQVIESELSGAPVTPTSRTCFSVV